MISVLVPYLNTEKYIEETLKSLLSQTYLDFEILCIDNCSTDRSREIVEEYASSHSMIKSLEFPHKGKSLALNYAITYSQKKWLAICDADDTWLPTKLEKQVRLIDESSEYDIIGTQMLYMDERSNIQPMGVDLPLHHQEMVDDLLLKRTNPMCNSSALYKRSLHSELIGFYNPLIFAVEDYDFWSRCALAGAKFINLKERLVCHRLHSQSSFNASNKQDYHKVMVDGRNDTLMKIYEKVGK